jgi:hypothetical protein
LELPGGKDRPTEGGNTADGSADREDDPHSRQVVLLGAGVVVALGVVPVSVVLPAVAEMANLELHANAPRSPGSRPPFPDLSDGTRREPPAGYWGKARFGQAGDFGYDVTVSDPVLVTLQDRSRANLGKLAEHDRYLVHREPDGTLIWEPAEVISITEARLLADERIHKVIVANRTNPSRLRRRDRSAAPRQ